MHKTLLLDHANKPLKDILDLESHWKNPGLRAYMQYLQTWTQYTTYTDF